MFRLSSDSGMRSGNGARQLNARKLKGDAASALGAVWSLLNPVVYLISGFRWSFYGVSDVSVGVSLAIILVILVACLVAVWWVFKTGYRLKS